MCPDIPLVGTDPAETPADNPIATMTRREMQVLSLLTQGLAKVREGGHGVH